MLVWNKFSYKGGHAIAHWIFKTFNQWSAMVVIGAGTFTSTNSFDTQSLGFVTMKELEKSMPGCL